MKNYKLLLMVMPFMLLACSKKDRGVNDGQAGVDSVASAFTPYTVTYKGGKYKTSGWAVLKDTPVYFYVSYFKKDSLHISCTGVYPGGNSGEILTVDERLYKNNSAIYYPINSGIRRLWFSKDSLVFEWSYADEVYKDPTGGTHYIKSWAYGINVKSHFR